MLGSDSGTGGVDSSLNIAGFLSQVGRSPTRDTVKRGVRQSTELCRSEGNNIGARRNYTLLRGGPLSSVTHNQPVDRFIEALKNFMEGSPDSKMQRETSRSELPRTCK